MNNAFIIQHRRLKLVGLDRFGISCGWHFTLPHIYVYPSHGSQPQPPRHSLPIPASHKAWCCRRDSKVRAAVVTVSSSQKERGVREVGSALSQDSWPWEAAHHLWAPFFNLLNGEQMSHLIGTSYAGGGCEGSTRLGELTLSVYFPLYSGLNSRS